LDTPFFMYIIRGVIIINSSSYYYCYGVMKAIKLETDLRTKGRGSHVKRKNIVAFVSVLVMAKTTMTKCLSLRR